MALTGKHRPLSDVLMVLWVRAVERVREKSSFKKERGGKEVRNDYKKLCGLHKLCL